MSHSAPLLPLLCLAACQSLPPLTPLPEAPLSWTQIEAMAPPPAGQRHAYGPAPAQFGWLRLPPGPGPHPVLVLIHGGCWLAEYDHRYFEHFAQAFTRAGYATWNIEYRRLGDAGGGWPGSFHDVGAAIDHLRVLARERPLDLDRVIGVGHSAGGQLALWAASRSQLAPASDLHMPDPLPLQAVLGLAPIVDLASYRGGPPGSCHAAVDRLLGGTPEEVPDRYADSSPLQRLPLGRPSLLISGGADRIVAPAPLRHFSAHARSLGEDLSLLELGAAGHFDLAVPTATYWPQLLRSTAGLLRSIPPP